MLGSGNVKQYRDGERFVLKKEYEKFKRRTNPIFLILVALALFFLDQPFLCLGLQESLIFYVNNGKQVFAIYYFASLVLRENILRVNGSHIKIWWILHHYLSIMMSVVMIFWPLSSETFRSFQLQFLFFCFSQGSNYLC